MTEHTPTPWKTKKRESSIVAYVDLRKGEMQVLYTSWHSSIRASYPLKDEAIANMEFVVKAVNNHDDLVQALQALVDQVNDYERVNNLAPNPGRTECWDTVARAKEVLARVSK